MLEVLHIRAKQANKDTDLRGFDILGGFSSILMTDFFRHFSWPSIFQVVIAFTITLHVSHKKECNLYSSFKAFTKGLSKAYLFDV